jgi:hypothetical protein
MSAKQQLDASSSKYNGMQCMSAMVDNVTELILSGGMSLLA